MHGHICLPKETDIIIGLGLTNRANTLFVGLINLPSNIKTTDQKTPGPFVPKRVPQTKDQQLPRKIEASDFRPRNFECCVRLSNTSLLCFSSTKPSSSGNALDSSVPFMDAEVARQVALGAVREVPFTKKNFYSRLFLVPKKEDSYRPVIDLSRLNHFAEHYHFQMENISCLKSLLNKGDFMTSINLKDAYLLVHIYERF